MSLTRIVGTIGPSSLDRETIERLVDAGLSVARLNASHSDLDWHAEAIRLVRSVAPEVPILLDVPGKKIRTQVLAHEPEFEAGDPIVLTTDPDHDGTVKVPVSLATLHRQLAPGHTILADDGTLKFTVARIEGRDIHCVADVAGQLRSRKGINVPHVKLAVDLVTDRDRSMIGFARTHSVDYIGVSFVESADHVEAVREVCGPGGPGIVAKIENANGLANRDEVIAAADAIMIDRGDLSVETRLDTLALEQKRILRSARQHAKPVIIATEMLHSMLVNPFPTKAEVTDITNAVLDGASAVMLSGETAAGRFPVEAVQTMRSVADAAEGYLAEQNGEAVASVSDASTIPGAMRDAIAIVARELPITKIVVVTLSGYAARVVASTRPVQPILAITNDAAMSRRFNLLSGTKGYHADVPFTRTSTDHITRCLEQAWQAGELHSDDLILVTAVAYPRSGNRMNLMQTHQVSDLIDTLGWKRGPG